MLAQLGAIAFIVAPVFGLIGLGFVASLSGHLRERAAEGLSEYVFGLAVPVLIFKTLAEAGLPEEGQPWGYWIAYFTGAFVVFGIAMQAARRLFGRDHTEAVVHGFTAGQSNTVFVGVPLILSAFGPAGAVPLFLLIAVHLPIMMVVATVLTEGAAVGLSPSTRSCSESMPAALPRFPAMRRAACSSRRSTCSPPRPCPARWCRSASPCTVIPFAAMSARR